MESNEQQQLEALVSALRLLLSDNPLGDLALKVYLTDKKLQIISDKQLNEFWAIAHKWSEHQKYQAYEKMKEQYSNAASNTTPMTATEVRIREHLAKLSRKP